MDDQNIGGGSPCFLFFFLTWIMGCRGHYKEIDGTMMYLEKTLVQVENR